MSKEKWEDRKDVTNICQLVEQGDTWSIPNHLLKEKVRFNGETITIHAAMNRLAYCHHHVTKYAKIIRETAHALRQTAIPIVFIEDEWPKEPTIPPESTEA